MSTKMQRGGLCLSSLNEGKQTMAMALTLFKCKEQLLLLN